VSSSSGTDVVEGTVKGMVSIEVAGGSVVDTVGAVVDGVVVGAGVVVPGPSIDVDGPAVVGAEATVVAVLLSSPLQAESAVNATAAATAVRTRMRGTLPT
jgi:hypothetical protein